jgi:hypothetical protein
MSIRSETKRQSGEKSVLEIPLINLMYLFALLCRIKFCRRADDSLSLSRYTNSCDLRYERLNKLALSSCPINNR